MPKKEVKYLGVTIDKGRTFGSHVQKICDKAERTAAALAKLMPNIGGPRQQKRVVMARVVESGMLYAASIWADAVQIGRHRERLLKAQRKMTLRIASAYRTVSTDAAGVIAGVLPMDLMVEERRECHMSVQRGMEVKEAKKVSRERAHAKWQERWNASTKAAWTRRLIPEIDKWLGRRHGEVCYQTTQFLTGHGSFGAYLHRIGKRRQEDCIYCAGRDTPEHAIFACERWTEKRAQMNIQLGVVVTPENFIDLIVESESAWKIIMGTVEAIIRRKERDMRET
ncbi:hypothetical protein NQ315_006554 [Exocentrus adspersus]|uniref:Reverse transcriptase n=1 Tax=Exocentrus adspersus TaxID=1586481 RepID=A0AAV8VFW0_9CUCU|nr:hypothetical protein NQ315_006554 [Exocentrus adspersus]